jgi:hypothetical protein
MKDPKASALKLELISLEQLVQQSSQQLYLKLAQFD